MNLLWGALGIFVLILGIFVYSTIRSRDKDW